MNQALLTRLFKAMQRKKNTPLIKIAYSIIEDEKRKGHAKLADKLSLILNENSNIENDPIPSLKIAKEKNYTVPEDRRYRLPLATHIEHADLRHEMVLSAEAERKILRIEKEYLARERLAHQGLRPRKKILFYGSSGCGKSMGG